MNRFPRIVLGLAGLLGVLALLANTSATAASEYDIEVVVFEYVVPDASDEFWPPDPGLPLAAGSAAYPAAERSLGGAVAQLRRSSEYRVLAHRAWRQPGVSQSAALPVQLQSEDGYNLIGSVSVWRQRYLHAELDLLLRPADGTEPVRMQQRRRMRSEELHYLDHPKLGVLIYATPVE